MSLQSVERIGRYELLNELGRGAMGVVYRAQDPTIGRVVALKTMRLDVHGLDTGEMLRRFRNEARAAGLLNHPNIVTIYDAGEHDGIFYIAMEMVEGTTLHQVLSETRVLAPEEVIHVTRQIASGLDYAHRIGIVHRDIKPANIMITASGTAKIMDFGIAKSGGSVTNTGQVLGTPNYMSPEQVKGKALDGRSDLFSLGVVLYEMVTGEKPFVGQNVTTIIYKIVNEIPITARDLDVTIHPGLSAVINKALAKSPDERYQSGAELMQDLENYKSAGAASTSMTASPAGVAVGGRTNHTQAIPEFAATATVPLRAATAAAAAPAKATATPDRPPATTVLEPKTRNLLVAVILAVLLAAAAVGGYGYRRYHAALKLEQTVKAEEAAQQSRASVTQEKAAGSTTGQGTAAAAPKSQNASDSAPKPKPAQIVTPIHKTEVSFASEPKGAKVEVDGWSEPSWITPFKATNLAAGAHNVVFSKDGYVRETRKLNLVSGKEAQLSAILSPAPSSVAVSSTPTGASIWIDGKDTGKTTPSQILVEKGAHTVVVRKEGFKDAATTADVVEGQTLDFSPALQTAPPLQVEDSGKQGSMLRRMFGADSIPEGKGLLHIRTVPDGATVVVNGRSAPRKTDVHWVLAPGSYDILLQKDGYKAVHRKVQVLEGKVRNLDEILEKQ
ncbi:MAG TPA: serine/threonine-protein kinase [Candidatus Angelobacter sp.]|nr:serine/threonine-protein kinase [Candidatus Angelobacter sp.]